MAFYIFGDYIREQRERMGVTQEDLCEGICSPGTLSKIENGRQGVRLNQYIALMERLGLPVQPIPSSYILRLDSGERTTLKPSFVKNVNQNG